VRSLREEGDAAALSYLYARFAGDVRRRVARVLGDEYDAEDVTQEIFSRLPRTILQYEDRGLPFAAWLMRVSRNAALDERRRTRPILVDEAPAPETQDVPTVPSDALKDALAALPPEQREVLLLRHIVGLRPAEVADRLGKSRAAVNCLHYRGSVTLRALLGRDRAPRRVMPQPARSEGAPRA